MRWLRKLLGIKTKEQVWRECVLAEARSRGLTAKPITVDGGIVFELTDPIGNRQPLYVLSPSED